MARFDGLACQVLKEPIEAPHSRLATFIRDYESFTSQIFIAHVRWANRGGVALKNTHPFSRTFRSRDVVLAHNGTVGEVVERASLKLHPVGKTDSELLFCALLTRLSQDAVAFADYERIEAMLREFNAAGSLNLLFSEGEHLFCYRDAGGYNRLCATRRISPYSTVSLRDEEWEIDLAEEKRADQRGYIIATRPLTDEDWADITPGSLLVLQEGECVYGSPE